VRSTLLAHEAHHFPPGHPCFARNLNGKDTQ
jgi:hypothetical protein